MTSAAKANHRDQTLLLIDSHALIHRAYHAFPPTLTNAKGELTNAVYGYASLLLDVLTKFKPSHVVAVFDAPGDTVRHEMYAAYKANRSSPDDELISQIPRVEDLLKSFDIPILRVPGYEADDIIGTIDERHSGEWARTIIVTGDRDLFQLVDEDSFVYLAGTSFSKSKLFGPADVEEKMGVGPDYIIDIKALEGDSSDNIPGVAGIGKKGAVTLVSEFGHLDEIYDRIEEVPNRYKNKLTDNYEIAKTSLELGTIICDAPVAFDFESAPFGTYQETDVQFFFQEMDFNSLWGRLKKVFQNHAPIPEPAAASSPDQPSLFGEREDIAEWDGKPIKAKHVVITGDFDTESDPLGWSSQRIFMLHDDQVIKVKSDQLADLCKQCSAEWVITDDGKTLLHVLANLKVKADFHIYDVVLGAYITAWGQVKQDLASAARWYELSSNGKPSERLEVINKLYELQKEEVGRDEGLRDLISLEQKLLPIVVQMERNGISLNVDQVAVDQDMLELVVNDIEQEIYDDVGHEFNVSSPKQVGEVLFEERGLPAGKKTKTGSYSTDERILSELVGADPVVGKILKYRELSKLLSTYLRPLPQLVNPKTNRIHASFNQIGAVTGRFSSNNPNMQNIPLGEIAGVNMRASFIPEPGHVFVALDYSQQELRLLAELSGEVNMKQAFREGQDIHATTAAQIFNKEIDEIDKEQRKVGKTINFGVVYGMSAFGFADRLKVDPTEAAKFIDTYFAKYPKVQDYFDEILEKAKVEGSIETLLGRKRGALGLKSPNYHVRKSTEREVMNFPLQGSAADIIKMAMVEVEPILKDYPVKLVLQVHDELIFEYKIDGELDELMKDKKFAKFVEEVRERMLKVIKLDVPLEVGTEVGRNWGELQDAE